MRRISRHKNGLTVITSEMPQMASVSVGIWVGVGGRHEAADVCGISHFIEHLLFKGTKRFSGEEMSRLVETAGGTQTRFSKGGASFASTNDPRHVFGLGTDAKVTKVTVHWPSGKAQEFAGVEPGAYWRLTEGETAKRK